MQRLTRQILAWLLALSTVVLAACTAVPAVPTDDTVEDANVEAGADAETDAEINADIEGTAISVMLGDNIREADQAAIDYCTEETDLDVNVVNGPESATDRLALYLQFFGAQSSDIDALMIDVIWPGLLAEHLVDMNQYVSEEEKAAYFPRIIENNTVAGELLGIPWFVGAGLLYYRTDLLDEYGFDGPPETWVELEEMAATIQEGERADNPDFWGYVWQGAAYEGLTCDALEWQVSYGGGEIVEPDGTITINNEQAALAFDTAAGWVGNISPPGVVGYQEEDARGVWQAGNAAFMRNWPYAYSLGQAEDSDIAGLFEVGLLPQGEGPDARNASTLGGWQMAVSRYSDNQDEAAAFAVCMTGYEAQKIRATVGSFNPTIDALYEDEEVLAANPFFGQLQDVFAQGAVARPSTVTAEDYNEVSTIYFQEVNRVLSGETDGATAVANIEAQLESLLQ